MFMTFEGARRPPAHDAHGHVAHGHVAHGHDAHGHDAHGHDAHGHDDHHGDGVHHAHESPPVMLIPLAILAVGATFAGWIFAPYFIGELAPTFWREAIVLQHGAHHHPPTWVIWAPLAVTLVGFLGACIFYLWNQGLGARIAAAGGPVHAFLFHKWFFDEIYDFIFVKGARALGDLFWKTGDKRIIDGLGPDGVSAAARFGGRQLRRVQTGYVYHYSFLMLIAAIGFGAYALWASAQTP
jgi:NADH-quinone oxidoreductase subunit L